MSAPAEQLDPRDETTLDMRSSGSSFARIARALGFGSAREANDAFHRAMRRRPLPERKRIRSAEFARLEELERSVRDAADVAADTRAKRLHTIERLRDRLLGD